MEISAKFSSNWTSEIILVEPPEAEAQRNLIKDSKCLGKPTHSLT